MCHVMMTMPAQHCSVGFMILQGTGDWSDLATVSGDAQETITLTVLGNCLVKTVQDVAAMPFTEFATLYAVSPNLR